MTCLNIPWEDSYIGGWIGEPTRELRIQKLKPKHHLARPQLNVGEMIK